MAQVKHEKHDAHEAQGKDMKDEKVTPRHIGDVRKHYKGSVE